MPKLSIVTPHYQDYQGLELLYSALLNQTVKDWEWIIVDDNSKDNSIREFSERIKTTNDDRVKIYVNSAKHNAATMRNIGINKCSSSCLVFVDSDDFITPVFVENRSVHVQEFKVFLRIATLCVTPGDRKELFSEINENFLQAFLSANFPWQTSAFLWNREFLLRIGGFNASLTLLEDVELAIRALAMKGEGNVDEKNELDFFYKVKPVDMAKRPFDIVCDSVDKLLFSLLRNTELDKKSWAKTKSYLYLIARYYVRSKCPNRHGLMLTMYGKFYKLGLISFFSLKLASSVFFCYQWKILSDQYFLKSHRFLFKVYHSG
jgi:glycosyltransferase involved in cell wall biosynthesis